MFRHVGVCQNVLSPSMVAWLWGVPVSPNQNRDHDFDTLQMGLRVSFSGCFKDFGGTPILTHTGHIPIWFNNRTGPLRATWPNPDLAEAFERKAAMSESVCAWWLAAIQFLSFVAF